MTDEFLSEVANVLTDKVENGELELGECVMDENPDGIDVSVDGRTYNVKFEQSGPDGDGSGIWIRAIIFDNGVPLQKNPTDKTVGIVGTHSSWDSPHWDEDGFTVVTPEPSIEYIW